MLSTRDRLILGPLRAINSSFKERPWKNWLRAQLLDVRNGLPRELMVSRGDVVVQVGMWRPRNLMRLSQCVGETGRVVLVEADQRVTDNLAQLIAAKNIQNVTIVNKGAFKERGTVEFNVGASPGHNRIDGTGVEMVVNVNQDVFDQKASIEVDTVDNIVADLGIDRVDYVEITVNGVELEVLEGMPNTLQHAKRLFLAGYARDSESGEPTNERTSRYLKNQGFRTTITRRIKADMEDFDRDAVKQWGLMDGHVFAWREATGRVVVSQNSEKSAKRAA